MASNEAAELPAPIVIGKSKTGFYKGFNRSVAISAKALVLLLVIWAASSPQSAATVLNDIRGWTLAAFGAWYMYVMGFFLVACLLLALLPKTGSVLLGQAGEQPEFSRFSWISMMFGAGIGIGMLTYSSAEPLYHFVSNPDVIKGTVVSQSAEGLPAVFKWSLLHWGLSAWGCYAVVGLSLAFFSFNRGQPLTIRSGVVALFGQRLEGSLGNIIDVCAVIATLLGIAVTIGLGVLQLSAGFYEISGWQWLVNGSGDSNSLAKLAALIMIMLASTLSAYSGVGKGIKWLSNINMCLSFVLFAIFLVHGAPLLMYLQVFAEGLWAYLSQLPSLLFTYWPNSEGPVERQLYEWQTDNWTIFIFVWWIAFAPFVGMFLARISRGRSIREFVFGALLVPSLMAFVWFVLVGGTAIDLELSGAAQDVILGAAQESQLFATLQIMLPDTPALMVISIVVVPLLITYLVTSGDSAILVVNTINAGGEPGAGTNRHIVIWGILITLIIGTLLLVGGIDALRAAMFLGALPFSLIMLLMCIALFKVLLLEKS